MQLPWLSREETILFGRTISPEVQPLLQQAVHAETLNTELAEQKLWHAQQMYPQELAIYVAICKFYLHHGRLAEALQTTKQALVQSAEHDGFAADWQELHADSTDWCMPTTAKAVYLYSLRMMSEILLRMKAVDESYRILNKLYELDPEDRVCRAVHYGQARTSHNEE